jgi:outer membrane protein G
MKKIITILVLGAVSISNAQSFNGTGDAKLNIAFVVQNGGTGILASTDYGFGENISIGFLASYLLSGASIEDVKTDLRLDAKLRLNANLGSVLNISPKFDVYPGLNLGLKNFGGHLGARYFFTEGFGLFAEFSTPFSPYDLDAMSKYNNGSTFGIGTSFNF